MLNTCKSNVNFYFIFQFNKKIRNNFYTKKKKKYSMSIKTIIRNINFLTIEVFKNLNRIFGFCLFLFFTTFFFIKGFTCFLFGIYLLLLSYFLNLVGSNLNLLKEISYLKLHKDTIKFTLSNKKKNIL